MAWGRSILDAITRKNTRALAFLFFVGLMFFVPGQFSMPPMDRDEPRFAQASKQMLETHDFVDIRFQGEARHKKPVGIYWLQAGVVALAEKIGVEEARRFMVFYRLPSLMGAILMMFCTYWAGLALLSREGALVAALMLGACVLLGVEARFAKTDALIGALSALSLGFMARFYLVARAPGVLRAPSPYMLPLFWAGLGLSILIKGPIVPLIVALCAFALVLRDGGEVSWLRPLRAWWGWGIVLLIVLPWLVLITMKTGGAFFSESIGKDMLAKVNEGQEKHGAPPGFYLLASTLTFWPVLPFFLLTLPFLWRERREDGVAFLLAWILPFWVMMELVPTKLPHYVLPTYPALALLVMLAAERRALSENKFLRAVAAFLFLLLPLALTALLLLLPYFLQESPTPYVWPFMGLALVFTLIGAWRLLRGRRLFSSLLPVWGAAFVLVLAIYPLAWPKLEALNLSPRLAAAGWQAARAAGCTNPHFATIGYREPSLVFLTQTQLMMLTPEQGAAFMAKGQVKSEECQIIFVEKSQEPAFQQAFLQLLEPQKREPSPTSPALQNLQLVNEIRGLNLNAAFDKNRKLRILHFAVYRKSKE